MFQQQRLFETRLDSKTYPLGEELEGSAQRTAAAIVALSHTALERRLYQTMLLANDGLDGPASFTVRRLMEVTGISSLSTIRRGLGGLAAKHCVERQPKLNGNGARVAYRILPPEEVIARRHEKGTNTGEATVASGVASGALDRVLHRVVASRDLSRREAQVALCCVEGLTNAEIGSRLMVSEQTVKFHLRNIFLKFGVKRRAELISRLLM